MGGEASNSGRSSVLIVEDDAALCALYEQYLASEQFEVIRASTGREALAILDDRKPKVVLLDLILPDLDGFEVLAHINDNAVPASVVVVTNDGSVDRAVEAMRLGAYDFLVKPFSRDRLITTIRNSIERVDLSRRAFSAAYDSDRHQFHGFIGDAPALRTVYQAIERVAHSKATVFITGESGTGKEVCAEAVHKAGPRAALPFVAVNCGAVEKNMMASELFGHVKGAFTGAVSDRKGAVQMAEGGTLFLDEICEMDMEVQTALLRFLQTGRFHRMGSSREETADVRVVCATNRDPMQAVRDGAFREDLYYRLHVVPLVLPPLRERGEDVILLAQYFLRQFALEEGKQFQRLSDVVCQILSSYSWPGNVRELQNLIRLVVVMNDSAQMEASMLPVSFQALARSFRAPENGTANGVAVEDDFSGARMSEKSLRSTARLFVGRPLAEIERHAIEVTIDACEGNIPRAARLLEVSPSTLYRKIEVWRRTDSAR